MKWPAGERMLDEDHRAVTAFLWWPRAVGGECRWLVRTTWVQRKEYRSMWDYIWIDVDWADKNPSAENTPAWEPEVHIAYDYYANGGG